MRKYINEAFPHFMHGADYNPEQWIDTKEIIESTLKGELPEGVCEHKRVLKKG